MCVCVENFKIYCLGNHQVCNTVLLAMLYIRSPGLIHLIPGSLYPLTSISSFCPHPSPWEPHFTLCFCDFDFLRFHIQVRSYSSYLSLSDFSLRTMPLKFIHVLANLFFAILVEYFLCFHFLPFLTLSVIFLFSVVALQFEIHIYS